MSGGTVSYEDYRQKAFRRLPRLLFDYIDGGSYDEVTLARNTSDFADLGLRQRVMKDMSTIDMSSSLFNKPLSMPLVLGPIGFAGMCARRGEVLAARAAHAAGVPFCLSTVGICGVEEVTAVAPSSWFQLYMIKDRGHVTSLLARIAAAGVDTLVLTVDLPIPGARYRDVRSGMAERKHGIAAIRRALDGLTHPRWLLDVYLQGRPHNFANLSHSLPAAHDFATAWEWIRDNFDRSVTWDDLAFLRTRWRGKIIVKGILEVADAREALHAGVDGIVVSNHGGRQLDGTCSTIKSLPSVVETVAGAVPILVDGGVRTGLDVLKAVASGASACLLGRAWAFPLAAEGAAGVARTLTRIRTELETAMVLTGTTSLLSAGPHILDQRPFPSNN